MSRSKWKGPYVFLRKKNNKKNSVISNLRRIDIVPPHVGDSFTIFSRTNRKLKLKVTEKMVGLKFGQFSSTRSVYVYKKKKKKKK